MKRRGEILTKFLLAVSMLLAVQTAKAQKEQPDTLQGEQLDEVVVTTRSARQRFEQVQIGVEQVQMSEVQRLPAFFGEHDIMRSVQLLPGVKAESEVTSGFQVRGGTSSQNSILLDDAPIYNVGHLMGLISAFNDNVIGSAALYKGLIPAQFGGATSAVMNIATRSGSMDRLHGNATVGLLSSKLSVEAPIVPQKLSFMLSARRSYMDAMMRSMEDFKDNTLYFYDLNAKLSFNLNPRNQIFVSFLASRDKMGVEGLMMIKWKNLTATGKWVSRLGNNAISNTSLIFSHFDTDVSLDVMGWDLSFTGFIRQGGLRQNFTFNLGRSHQLEAGLQSMLISLKSAEWKLQFNNQREKRPSWENNVWVSDLISIGKKLKVLAGLRLNSFTALGGADYYQLDDDGMITERFDPGKWHNVKTWLTLEPRLSMNLTVNDQIGLKAGYSRTAQNIHALRNQSASTPFDRFTASSNLLQPQIANQWSAGLHLMTKDRRWDLTLEGYYKKVEHVLDYKDGKSFNSEIEVERIILPGNGRAYGAEFCLHKNIGKLTGWLSYTLAWSENKIPGINGGRWYTASNDRRHDVAIVGIYALNDKWDLSATWTYNTGRAFTAPSAKYEMTGNVYYYYAERNGYREPANHRLDLSARWHKKLKGGKISREWTFGVYNAYNHYNPFIIVFQEDRQEPTGTRATQYSMFGILPSISLSYQF